MSNENTKIELLTEAIETLVLASVHAAIHAPRAQEDIGELAQQNQLMLNVRDARDCLSDSLRIFLRPALRVLNPAASVDQPLPAVAQA